MRVSTAGLHANACLEHSNTFEHNLQVEIPRKENEGDPASANGVEGEGAGERGGEVCTEQSSVDAEVGRGREEAGENGVAAWCREEATSAKQVPDCQTLREW